MQVFIERNNVSGTRIAEFIAEDSLAIPRVGDTISVSDAELTQNEVLFVDYDYHLWGGKYHGVVVTIIVK
jgi:hypothetical protein